MRSLKPAFYDFLMCLAGRRLDPWRRALAAGASGRVLELGIGTGQNLRFYGSSACLVGAEPDLRMLQRARRRAAVAPLRVGLVAAVGEALPFRDGSFDEVIASLVF